MTAACIYLLHDRQGQDRRLVEGGAGDDEGRQRLPRDAAQATRTASTAASAQDQLQEHPAAARARALQRGDHDARSRTPPPASPTSSSTSTSTGTSTRTSSPSASRRERRPRSSRRPSRPRRPRSPKKAEAEATVAELEAQYDAAVEEKEDVIAEAEQCERKLGLAQRLMTALGSEGARWKQAHRRPQPAARDPRRRRAPRRGLRLLHRLLQQAASAELHEQTYLPYLTGAIAVRQGRRAHVRVGAPTRSRSSRPRRSVAGWNSETLPADRVSIENGAIVTSCARWPLMIDPQLQGITWIKKHEEKNGLKIVRLGQKTLMPQLGPALENGLPVLIENIQLPSTRCSARSSAGRRQARAATLWSSWATRRSTTRRSSSSTCRRSSPTRTTRPRCRRRRRSSTSW